DHRARPLAYVGARDAETDALRRARDDGSFALEPPAHRFTPQRKLGAARLKFASRARLRHMTRRGWRRARSDGDANLDGIRRLVGGEGLLDALQGEAVGDERLGADGAFDEETHRFGKFLAIDHRAQDPNLAAHDGEEVHGGRLMREPGEHDAPARVRELEGLLDRACRARRLDHDVDAFAPRKGPRRRHSAAHFRGGEVVGAQRLGQIPATARAPDREHPEAARFEHLDGGESEGADAEHGRALARLHLATGNGTHDHGKWLSEHELIVSNSGGRGPAAARGQPRFLREAAVRVDAQRGAGEAEIAITLSAEGADSTREVRLYGDPLAGPQSIHAGAHRGDVADELMTHDERIGHRPVAAPDPIVSAAEPGSYHAHDHLPGRRLQRLWPFDAEVTRAVQHCRSHGGHPTEPPTERQGEAGASSPQAAL